VQAAKRKHKTRHLATPRLVTPAGRRALTHEHFDEVTDADAAPAETKRKFMATPG